VRVLFLEVDTERDWGVASLGPSFIAAYLRLHGHESLFVRAAIGQSTAEIVRKVVELDPDLLGVSLTTRQWKRARALVGAIRDVQDLPVVAGGLHPTFCPEAVLSAPGFDYVCLGEGEEAALELVDALEQGRDTSSIRNIWACGGDRPMLRPPFAPLDAMPFLARDMLDELGGCVHVTTQRGCPFPCTYCGARTFHDLYDGVGDYGRRRSTESVLEELEGIRQEASLDFVIFLDDTFTIHRPWVEEFCGAYRGRIGVPFSVHARVETVDQELLRHLADAGCRHITYGVESGSDRIRREVMRRPVENRRFRDVFDWTREAGIMITANYMLGLPEETRDDLQATLDLAQELAAFDFGHFVFYPYPGTPLFDHCRDKGYLTDEALERDASDRESVLDLPTISKGDIAEYYDRFTALRASLHASRARAAGSPGSAEHRDATGHVGEGQDLG
jgi:radical SAM superfamily enzyme YgiQ (UPF0313 family)